MTIKAGNFLGFSPEQTLKINVKPIPPALSQNPDDLFASNVLGTSASVNFKIDDTGGQDANVTVYYDSSMINPPGLGWWHPILPEIRIQRFLPTHTPVR